MKWHDNVYVADDGEILVELSERHDGITIVVAVDSDDENAAELRGKRYISRLDAQRAVERAFNDEAG